MIVNGRGKLKSCAGWVCLFSKQSTMQTNRPCKQIEKKQGMWQHHSLPPPKKIRQTKSTQGTAATRGKKEKQCGFAYCPAIEEVRSNEKQADGTAPF